MENFDWIAESEFFRIEVDPTKINFIQKPEDFYNELKERTENAKKRVIMTSLYLGNGEKEKELVQTFKSAQEKNPSLKIKLLFDYFRGTRKDGKNNESSADILAPIASDIEAYFYHTPNMNGIKSSILPGRLAEIIGLQHMKFFIFDDTVIISGANLSNIYFTNRQDRYMIIEDCPFLAQFFSDVLDIVISQTKKLNNLDGEKSRHFFTPGKPFRGNIHSEIQHLFKKYKELTKDCRQESDTFIVPFLQMGSHGIFQENKILEEIISNNRNEDSTFYMATGYFNLHEDYAKLFINKITSKFVILFASPEANGFYNASGMAGFIPSIYLESARNFLSQVIASKKEIKLLEWRRQDWTFHAKGFWKVSPEEKNISMIIGSSNYGYRSVHRDLEAQVLLNTNNAALKEKIKKERDSLFEHAFPVEFSTFVHSYRIPRWIEYISKFFRTYF